MDSVVESSRRIGRGFLKGLLGIAICLATVNAAAYPANDPPPPAPGTPSSLTVPATDSDGSVSISWGASSGSVSKYYLQRRKDGGSYYTVYNGTSRSFVNSGLSSGTYDYRVNACYTTNGGTSCSGYRTNTGLEVRSSSGNRYVSMPLTLTGTSSGNHVLTWGLSGWTDENNSGSYESTYDWGYSKWRDWRDFCTECWAVFNLQRSSNNGSTWSTVFSFENTESTTKTFTGISGGSYKYRVMIDYGGLSNRSYSWEYISDIVSINTSAATPSSISISPTNSSNGTQVISWGNSAYVSKYTLRRQINDGSWTTLQDNLDADRKRTDTGLSSGKYEYAVRACVGSSCSSYKYSSATYVARTPGAISTTAVTNDPDGVFTVSWGASNGSVDSYQLQRYSSVTSAWDTMPLTSSRTYSQPALETGTYQYRVRSKKGTAYSSWTAIKTVSVLRIPGAPSSFIVPNWSTDGSLAISWGTASGVVSSYQLYRRTADYNVAGTGTWTGFTSYKTLTSTLWDETGLSDGLYDYQVRACNASGCSSFVDQSSTTVLRTPTIPTGVTVIPALSDGRFSLSWNDVPEFVEEYQIEQRRSIDLGVTWEVWATDSKSPYGDLDANNAVLLEKPTHSTGENTYYRYKVAACNESDCSDFSSTVDVVVQPPGTPETLLIDSMDTGADAVPLGSGAYVDYDFDGDYSLYWTSVAGNDPAIEYRIEKFVGGVAFNGAGYEFATSDINSLNYAETGLLDGKTYSYVVEACLMLSGSSTYHCGDPSYSYDVIVALPPEQVTGLSLSPGSGSEIDLSWTAPSTGTVTGYLIEYRHKVSSAGTWSDWDRLADAVDDGLNQPDITNTNYSTSNLFGDGGGVYEFRVSGCNQSTLNCGGTSHFVVEAPSEPLDLSLSYQGADYGLDWNAPISGTITLYLVETRFDQTGDWLVDGSVSAAGTTYSSSTLVGSQSGIYESRVKACNLTTLICSAPSNIASKKIYEIDDPTLASLAVPTVSGVEIGSSDEIGSIQGNFDVSSSGAASYNIPITVPQGTAGVAPQLSLNYSSGGGSGIAGLGWNLSGVSAITRCRKTLQQDMGPSAIGWDADDRYCVDGQRMLLVSGTYGSSGSTYRTEIDGFATITAVNGTAGDPDYFRVERKDGSTSYYGQNSASSSDGANGKTNTWAINQFQDNVDNKIVFTYLDDPQGDGHYIENIYYAYGSSTSSNARVKFIYEDRADDTFGYVGGELFAKKKRLDSIQVFNKESGFEYQIRQYNTYYDEIGLASTADDNLSRLTSIEECVSGSSASSGVGCLPKTTFEWSLPAQGLSANLSTIDLGAQGFGATNKAADINGDGVLDILYYDYSGNLKYLLLQTTSSGGYSFEQGLYTNSATSVDPTPSGGATSEINTIDYNQDGRADVVVGDEIYLSVPQSDGSWRLSSTPIYDAIYMSSGSFFADIDSDGLQDVVNPTVGWSFPGASVSLMSRDSSEPISSSTAYSLGDTYYPQSPGSYLYYAQEIYDLGDFNGDGITDLIGTQARENSCSVDCWGGVVAQLNLLSFDASNVLTYESEAFPTTEQWVQSTKVADFNGDGLSDLLHYVGPFASTGGTWRVRISTGDGYLPMVDTGIDRVGLKIGDYNNDGYSDLYWVNSNGSSNLSQWRTSVKRWDPSIGGFESGEVNMSVGTVDTDYYSYYQLMDLNSDGQSDLVRIQSSEIEIYANYSLDTPVNKIVKITNGLNAETDITYEPIQGSEHYAALRVDTTPTSEWEESCSVATVGEFYTQVNQAYSPTDPLLSNALDMKQPLIQMNKGISVVTNVAISSPTENSAQAKSSYSYYYRHARAQAGGRGFVGFADVRKVDEQNSMETITTYRQDWPFIGSPLKTEVKTGAGDLVSRTENIWNLRSRSSSDTSTWQSTLDSSGTAALGPITPFLERSVQKTYDPYDGTSTALSTVVSDALRDGYGNPLEVSVRTYQGDQSNPDSSSYVSETLTENKYDIASGSTLTQSYINQFGRNSETTVTTTRKDGSTTDTSVRKTTFEYYGTTDTAPSGGTLGGTYLVDEGMLKSESTWLDGVILHTSEHYYDAQGHRVMTRIDGDADDDGTADSRYSALTTYDSTGRYVETTHDLFASGSSTVKRLVTSVVDRNEYGTPTEARSYLDDANYITSKTYSSARGIPYFSADSSGIWSETVTQNDTSQCRAGSSYSQISTAAGGSTAIECFDLLGRSTGRAAKNFDGTWVYTKTYYDESGRVTKSFEPESNLLSTIHYSETAYDDLGRVTRSTSPSSDDTDFEYDGLSTRTISPRGNIKDELRNVLGEIIRVYENKEGAVSSVDGQTLTSSERSQSSYSYDADGNLIVMSDADSNITLIDYDGLGRKTGMNDPDKGLWLYKYNAFGEMLCQEDGKTQTIESRYDFKGRLVSRTDREAGGSCQSPSGNVVGYSIWTYDSADKGLGQLHMLVQKTDSTDTIADYQQTAYYDSQGRLSRSKTAIEGNADDHWAKTTYDQYGRVFQEFDAARTRDSYADNGTQSHYNSYGYLEKITDVRKESGQYLSTYYQIEDMDNRGNVTEATYGDLIQSYADYEPDTGYLDWMMTKVGLNTYQNYDLDWDEVGNLDQRANLSSSTGGSGSQFANETESFVYDGLNRLERYTVNAAITTIGYSGIGNMTSKSDFGGNYSYGTKPSQCSASGHVTPGPHALSSANGNYYCYDANGNMLADGTGRTLAYSVFDKVTNLDKGDYNTSFEYGPDRARYRRVDTNTSTGDSTTTLYLGGVEKIYNDDGIIEWKRNIAGIGQITQTVTAQGGITDATTHYFLKDHLGSITHIFAMDASGIVQNVEEMAFDPWGARRTNTDWRSLLSQSSIENSFYLTGGAAGSPTTSRGFTGHEMVDEMDIIHMNGRIFDAKSARFLQADPIIQAPYLTASLNRYSYVWNNPMNATDPSGYEGANSLCNYEYEDSSCAQDAAPKPKPSGTIEEGVTTGVRDDFWDLPFQGFDSAGEFNQFHNFSFTEHGAYSHNDNTASDLGQVFSLHRSLLNAGATAQQASAITVAATSMANDGTGSGEFASGANAIAQEEQKESWWVRNVVRPYAERAGIDKYANTPSTFTEEEKAIIFFLGTGGGAIPGKFSTGAPKPLSIGTGGKETFTYASRVRARGVEDPKAHNFPYSFDKNVLSTQPTTTSTGYRIYQAPGTMNGKAGVFEIGVTPKSVIDHRFFRPN